MGLEVAKLNPLGTFKKGKFLISMVNQKEWKVSQNADINHIISFQSKSNKLEPSIILKD